MSVKFRVTGTREEVARSVALLRLGFAVREESGWYTNTRGGASELGRIYVEVDVPADDTAHYPAVS